jgi:hypothetical protein
MNTKLFSVLLSDDGYLLSRMLECEQQSPHIIEQGDTVNNNCSWHVLCIFSGDYQFPHN